MSFQRIITLGIGVLLTLLLATTILGVRQSRQGAANLDIATGEHRASAAKAGQLSQVLAELNSLFTVETSRKGASVRGVLAEVEAALKVLEGIGVRGLSPAGAGHHRQAAELLAKVRAMLLILTDMTLPTSSCTDLIRDYRSQQRGLFEGLSRSLALLGQDVSVRLPARLPAMESLDRTATSIEQQMDEVLRRGTGSGPTYNAGIKQARVCLEALRREGRISDLTVAERLMERLTAVESHLPGVLELVRLGDTGLPRLREESAAVADALGDAVVLAQEIDRRLHADIDAELAELRMASLRSRDTFVVFSGVGLAFGLVIAATTSGMLRRRVQELSAGARAFAEGRLDYRLDETARDALGGLACTFNSMAGALAAKERDLRAATEAAEAASRAKTDFLARMSHEIRTPMNAIINLTDLTLEKRLADEDRERLSMVSQSAHRLLKLINQVLDISKVEAGKMELELDDVDPVQAMAQVVEGLRASAEGKGLRLALELPAPPPGAAPWAVRADGLKLQQIVTNLLGNAIKFTEAGEVRVAVRCAADISRPGLVDLSVVVADTGVGIPEDKLESIFGAFDQADPSTTRKFGGTGLGLSIARQLARLMGGDVTAQSPGGRGAAFTLTLRLPAGDPAKLPKPEPQGGSAQQAAGPLRVLVVEDNPFNQHVAEALLKRMGHAATIAAGGMEALDRLSGEPFDLVLMDIEMPGLDGMEVTRRIRQGAAGDLPRHVPVCAMTAHAVSGYREKCLAAGMDDYIAKPLRVPELAAALGRVRPAAAIPAA